MTLHESVMTWVGAKVAEHDLADLTTLEVGSFDVNGSVRPLFRGPYAGIDFRPGPGVDEVAEAKAIPHPDGSFDVVVSTEMLEHDPTFWLSLPEMARALAPGGVLLVTTRGIGFGLHEYPSDYWRFTVEAVRHLFTLAGLDPVEVIDDPQVSGVFGLARKPEGGSGA